MGLNYGSDKVRYLTPVKVGQRVRARGTIADIGEKRPGQWLVKTNVTVEIGGEDPIVYQKMTSEKIRQVFKEHVLAGQVQEMFRLT